MTSCDSTASELTTSCWDRNAHIITIVITLSLLLFNGT